MAAFIERPIPSMMGQPGYEIDPVHPQVYGRSYIPTTTAGGQQILLTSPQPFQVIPTGVPQYGHQTIGGHQFVLPSPNVMHVPQVGDVHASPPYAEVDMTGYPRSRMRRTTMSGIPISPGGHYAFAGSQMGHQMGHQLAHQMEFQYCTGMVEACLFCQANHPTPHPLMQGHGPLPSVMPMSRPMPMDDPFAGNSRFEHHRSQRRDSTQMPLFDPFDAPWNANFQRRGDFDSISSKRSRSIGPRRLTMTDDMRIAEMSESDDEEDMRGRSGPGRRSGPSLSRRGSMHRLRSSSRASRAPSNPPFV